MIDGLLADLEPLRAGNGRWTVRRSKIPLLETIVPALIAGSDRRMRHALLRGAEAAAWTHTSMNAIAVLANGRIRLLRADPHRWGAGLVHKIDLERDLTMCGRTPVNCPGTPFVGVHYEITCKLCLRSIDSRIRQAEMAQQYEARAAEREAERQKQEAERQDHNRRWWGD
jgi:hypothetical protein